MAWTTISNLLVAVGAKPFATTIQALRDNPISIAAGDAGAPKVKGQALDIRISDLVISGTNPQGWTDIDRAKDIRFDFHFTNTLGSAQNLQWRFSNDAGGSWGSYISGPSAAANGFCVGALHINVETGAWRSYETRRDGSGAITLNTQSGTTAPPSGVNGLQFRCSSTGSAAVSATIMGGVSP